MIRDSTSAKDSLEELENRLDFIWSQIRNTPVGDEQNRLRERYGELVRNYNKLKPNEPYKNPGQRDNREY